MDTHNQPTSALDPTFGFDSPDDAWLSRLRQAQSPIAPGYIGEYRVIREIARGGQGVVYQAVQPRTERPVAIKCIPGWHIAGASARARFEREIEAICTLAHPGIVTLHEVQLIDGQPVIAMEWVEGEPIDRWAAALPLDQLPAILAAFLQVCDSVAHAHRRGVIHRDLKPGNILMDAQSRPRVLDFGLASFTASAPAHATGHGGFIGTPLYASPEQIAEDPSLDTRTDVYSLGVILYQLVTGVVPFDAPSTAEIFDRVRAGHPRTPSSLRRRLPAALDSIIAKAMDLKPDRRYSTVDSLAEDLRRLLSGESVLAHSASAWYRISRVIARRPWTFAGAALALAALVALLVFNSILTVRLGARGKELAAALTQAEDARSRAQHTADANAAAVALLQDLLNSVQHAARSRSTTDPFRHVLARACDSLEQARLSHDPQSLVLWSTLADLSSRDRYPSELERCVIAGAPLCESLHGANSPQYAEWLIYSGLVRESHRDQPSAATFYARARELLRAADQVNSEPYARATYNLGAMYMGDRERIAQAEPLLNESLRIRQVLHGENSAPVVRSLAGLGDLMRRQGRFEDAAAYLDRAESRAAALDPFDPQVLVIPVIRSRVFYDQQNYDAAASVLRTSLDALVSRVTPDSPLLAGPLSGLVDIAERQGQFDNALAYSDRLLLTLEDTNEPARVIEHIVRRAKWLVRLNRIDQAETELRAALSHAIALQPARQSLIGSVQSALDGLHHRNEDSATAPAPAPTRQSRPQR